jgi:hypothetical protein
MPSHPAMAEVSARLSLRPAEAFRRLWAGLLNGRGKSPPGLFPGMKTSGFRGRFAPGTSSLTCGRLFNSLLTGRGKSPPGLFLILAAWAALFGTQSAQAIEMFTFFGDGSRIGLPSLEVPIEAYPGIPLRSDRIRMRTGRFSRGSRGAATARGPLIRQPVELRRSGDDSAGGITIRPEPSDGPSRPAEPNQLPSRPTPRPEQSRILPVAPLPPN